MQLCLHPLPNAPVLPSRLTFLSLLPGARRRDEGIDVLGLGVEGGDEANRRRIPAIELEARRVEMLDRRIRQLDEDLVRLDGMAQASARHGSQAVGKARCHSVGMAGVAQPEVAGEIRVELGALE